MNETARQLAAAIRADLVEIWELEPDDETLFMRAGVGWRDGLVGITRTTSSSKQQIGLTLAAGEPIEAPDVANDPRFHANQIVVDHGAVSGVTVVIAGPSRSHGVIGVYTKRRREFSADEVNLLRAVANVLAAAIKDSRSEQALSDSASRVRAIVNTLVDGIITIDERGTIDSLNPAAERLFGYAARELIGRNVKVLMPNPYRREHDGYIENYLTTGHAKIIGIGREVAGQRKNGTLFPMDLAVSEFSDAGRRMFTGIVRDITERRRLEKEILDAASEEQRRIGRDLHDGLCQQLAGVAFAVEVLSQKLAARTAPETAGIQKVGELIDQAITQARDLARGLQPVALEPGGLAAALEAMAGKVQAMFHVSCLFVSDEPSLVPDNAIATHLYRIAQEAVSNALRHGKAKTITIDLVSDLEAIHLTVSDNGIGLKNAASDGKGTGLRTMTYRAGLVGGTLTARARAAGGTIVTCTIPNMVVERGPSKKDEHAKKKPSARESKNQDTRRRRPSDRP